MENYVHSSASFQSFDGLKLFYQKWLCKDAKGVVIIAHGLGEHSSRYSHLVEELAGKGVSFYALDHRGHGRSEGKRGHISSFSDFTADLASLVEMARRENPAIPLILLGHSMGGVIAFQYVLQQSQAVDGLILSSAGLIPILDVPGWLQSLVKVLLSRIVPGLTISNGLDASGLSHDQPIVNQYLDDPLVHDKVTARWFQEFAAAGQDSLNRAGELTLPLLIIHGQNDPIVDYKGSVKAMELASSSDKTLHIFEGLLHETMNEPQELRQEVLNRVGEWIVAHIS
jgi:alpha-beta hydrolase superfamily lysophospholipase